MRELIAAVDNYDDTAAYDSALQDLEDMPLSFEKIITDHRHESITWEILLGTAWAGDRDLVVTDYNGSIESAEYQFQDWFQPCDDCRRSGRGSCPTLR